MLTNNVYSTVLPVETPLYHTCLYSQVKRRRQRRELPADVVGPGCNYMPQPVPNNTPMLEVFVSNVLTPSHFWLQLKGARTSDALSDLMDELE